MIRINGRGVGGVTSCSMTLIALGAILGHIACEVNTGEGGRAYSNTTQLINVIPIVNRPRAILRK